MEQALHAERGDAHHVMVGASVRWWALGAFSASWAYAAVRYVVFKGLPVDRLPLFVTNKALALSGLILLTVALLSSPGQGRPRTRWSSHPRAKGLGQWGLALTSAHVLASTIVLAPPYFESWYCPDGALVARAEAAVLAGVLAFIGLVWVGRRPPRSSASIALVLATSGIHALLIGYPTWMVPSSWPGHMPPITMISFILSAFGCAAWRRAAK